MADVLIPMALPGLRWIKLGSKTVSDTITTKRETKNASIGADVSPYDLVFARVTGGFSAQAGQSSKSALVGIGLGGVSTYTAGGIIRTAPSSGEVITASGSFCRLYWKAADNMFFAVNQLKQSDASPFSQYPNPNGAGYGDGTYYANPSGLVSFSCNFTLEVWGGKF